eukprot:g83119.t1
MAPWQIDFLRAHSKNVRVQTLYIFACEPADNERNSDCTYALRKNFIFCHKRVSTLYQETCTNMGMEWLVVDKDLPEAQGIIDFDKDVHIFVCYFHVKEAIHRWLVASKNQVPAHLHEIVKQAVSQLDFIAGQDKYCAATDVFWIGQRRNIKGYLIICMIIGSADSGRSDGKGMAPFTEI